MSKLSVPLQQSGTGPSTPMALSGVCWGAGILMCGMLCRGAAGWDEWQGKRGGSMRYGTRVMMEGQQQRRVRRELTRGRKRRRKGRRGVKGEEGVS